MTSKEKKIGEEMLAKLKHLTETETYTEYWHEQADKILCELLTKLGFTEIVELFEKEDKWYS
jgi:hypothetical protein